MKFRPRSAGNTTSKPRRPFGDPVAPPAPHPNFVAIPSTHKQPARLSYDLATVLDAALLRNIQTAGMMVFHSVGDTGDVDGTGITRDLAEQMEAQVSAAAAQATPAFLYHLGDVVYFNGVSTDYRDQFYDPYKFYPPLIFAIPGNHDGQVNIRPGDPPDPEPSLTGFFDNFCDVQRNPSQSSPYRFTMNQPWVFWTLNTPLATIIGLYSNQGGSLDPSTSTQHPQYSWLVGQLQQADKNMALILAVHHSPFSLDSEHGGYADILDAIDQAVAASGGRYPDLVLSGHVHNYQRFHRQVKNGTYVHLIAGAGGYASVKLMHKLQLDPVKKTRIQAPFKTTRPDTTLMNYNEDLPGFLRITIDKQHITGEYFTNDLKGDTQSVTPFDSFTFDYVNKKMIKGG